MPKEIERKFLLASGEWRAKARGFFCRQGYLAVNGRCAARVRIARGRAYLTIKGNRSGISRDEYEYRVPVGHANEMLERLCEQPIIEKTRHLVREGGVLWEIDEFSGENRGLVVAEVELRDEAQAVALPPWIGREVTADPKYLNASLVRRPYRLWSEAEKAGM
ncbi:MAG: CYTH domain-containing protein [Lentisphaerae bacterium]|nr:CYTH domain-containing protein [Lentisphaerota bacterium]